MRGCRKQSSSGVGLVLFNYIEIGHEIAVQNLKPSSFVN